MALAGEHRGEPLTPDLLHRREDAQLVIDHHVVPGWVTLLDRGEHPLLVQVDEHPPLHRIPQSRALYLARLEYDVAIGQDHRWPEGAAVREHCQRARIEAIDEGIIEEKKRNTQQLLVIRMLQAIALQRAEVVRITELGAQLLEDLPVTVPARKAHLALEVRAQIVLHGIVIEKGIVDVEEKDGRCDVPHSPLPRGSGISPTATASVRCALRSGGRGAVNPGAGYALAQDQGRTEVPAVTEHNFLSRVVTLTRSHLAAAGLAIAVGTLASCNGNDSTPNLPVIIPVPNSIAVADVGNGVPDLLVATTADEGGALNPGYADIIMNTPGSPGTFQKGVHYSTTGTNPSSIAVGDFTGSGGFDLAIANFGNGSVSVFMHGATPGTFDAAVDVPTGGQPNQVVASDLGSTGKGHPALILADMSSSGNVIVLKPDPANPGKFLAPMNLPTRLTTTSVAVADLTRGGGLPAVVAATYDSSGNNGAVQ